MDKNKKTAIIFYLAAVIFYISAIIWFFGKNTSIGAGIGILCFCVGSAFLCTGSVWLNRSGNKEEQQKDETDE